jgi:hypothetical protein
MNPIKKHHAGCALFFGVALLSVSSFATPVTLVSQDFDSLTPQSVANGAILTVGTSKSALALATASSTSLQILNVSAAAGDNALRYIDNQNGGSAPNAWTPFFT